METAPFTTLNVAKKKESIQSKIPFDEKLIMCEDQQWSRDVLRAGYAVVYQSQAKVWHSHARSLGEVFRRHFDMGVSLKGLLDERFWETFSFGISYVLQELRFIYTQGAIGKLPYLLLYEAVRAGGFFLGQYHAPLPLWLKRRCSEHRYYWNQVVG